MKETRFSQRVFINIFFAVVLVAFLITIFFSYHQIEKVSTTNQWVKHTNLVIEKTNNILLDFMEIESRTRGFLISADTSIIENLDEKIKNILSNFNLEKDLTKDNSQQQFLLAELEPILNDRIALLKKLIGLKLNNKLKSNAALQMVSQGQNLTEKIKKIIKEIYDNEIQLLQQREESFQQNYNFTNILFNTVNIINLCLLTMIIMLFNKMLSHVLASQALEKKSELLLRGIIDGSKEYIAALDPNYTILACNKAFEIKFLELFGKMVTTGMNFKDALAHLPKEQRKAVEIWDRALKGEEFTVIEKFGSDDKTRSQFEITYSSIYNEKGKLIGAAHIVRDVGKRVEGENMLKDSNKKLEISLSQVESQAKEMIIINDMNNKMRSGASMEETLSIISLYLKKLLPFCSGAIYLMNHSRNYLEAAKEWNEPQSIEKIFSPDQCWGLRQGKSYLYVNKNESIPCKHAEKENSLSYFCVPLLALNEIIGILYLQIAQSLVMEKNEIIQLYEKNSLMIQSVASQISLAISNIRLHEALKTRSNRDLLTNLYNRSYLSDTFERDVQRAKRNKTHMAVVMMDLDLFKNINDNYGHEAGDTVLREIGKLILTQLRKSDIACRYGGEEFIIILYDALLKEVVEKIEQLRKSISALEFRFVDLVTVTASFGIAMFPENGEDPEQLIKAADDALYQSKKAGRNRVTYKGLNTE